jgi:DNA polymerase
MSKPPYKRILVVDFETRWDRKGYTLSKLTTEQYIRNNEFKAFGACFKDYGVDNTEWVTHDRLQAYVDSIDWSETAVLAHNAQFDVAILSWVYGVKPCFVFDSLSMARALRGVDAGNGLAQLANEFGLPPKGNAVHSTDGLIELPPEVEKELADYCKHDTFLCEEVFKRLINGYPAKELRLIDMTLKMFINPVLVLDKEILSEAIEEERTKRHALLSKLGIEETALASNQQFADVLQSMGVKPPTKISKTTGRETLALAKNDALFQALLNSGNEDVELLCEARLAVKSTLERTRAQRFLDIAGRGNLPVPLNYYGAHTGRWSASKGSGLNLQNLKRGSFLRKSIQAPDGYTLIVCDLSQIEPRVLAWLADYDALLNIFSSGQDPYAQFGAQMFGIPDLSKESHPDLRQSAKSALLGAGYGMGWASFAAQLLTGFLGAPPTRYDKAFAKQLGITSDYIGTFLEWEDNVKRLNEIPHTCTENELLIHAVSAKKIIDKYRAAAEPVTQFWHLCQELIQKALAEGRSYHHKCLQFEKEKIILPNQMALRYPSLKGNADAKGRLQWAYGSDGKKLYGGKLTENIVQAVARCVMTDGMLRIQERYPCVLTVHDEVVCLVPEAQQEDAKTWVLAQMVMEPKYMPKIPLEAEIDSAKRYGDAK